MQLFSCVCLCFRCCFPKYPFWLSRLIWSVVHSTAGVYTPVYANVRVGKMIAINNLVVYQPKPFRYCSSGTDLHRTTGIMHKRLYGRIENFVLSTKRLMCVYVCSTYTRLWKKAKNKSPNLSVRACVLGINLDAVFRDCEYNFTIVFVVYNYAVNENSFHFDLLIRAGSP